MKKKCLTLQKRPARATLGGIGSNLVHSIARLPGDRIIDVKMYYEVRGINGWLDYVVNYLMLEKNGIINFPTVGDLTFRNATVTTKLYPISKQGQSLIIGQTIREIYFHFDKGIAIPGSSAFIELSNGRVIYEHRMAPHRTGAANLYVYTSKEFAALKEEFRLIPLKY